MPTHVANQHTAEAGAHESSQLLPTAKRSWRLPLRLRRTRLMPVTRLVEPEQFALYLDTAVRQISDYYTDASISVVKVPIKNVRPLSRVVEEGRYRRAKRLRRRMRLRRISLFEPCLLRYRGEDTFRLVLPPVVEKRRRNYVVVDGVHRLTGLYKSKTRQGLRHLRWLCRWLSDEVAVVVIEGVLQPAAATSVGFEEIAVPKRNGPRPKKNKFRRLRKEFFRPANATLSGSQFRFTSTDSFVEACRSASRR